MACGSKFGRGGTSIVNYSRRDLGLLLPALAAASGQAQSKVLPSKAYKYEDLPVRGSSRAVLNGETHSGFPIEMHITELPAGQAPHPPHQHRSGEHTSDL